MDALHIVIALDNSESMEDRKQPTLDALNHFIIKQQSVSNGDALFSFVTFNNTPSIITQKIPIQQVQKFTEDDYHPSGMTALYDAIGFVITSLIPLDCKTIFCVITDGEENYSKYYTQSAISHLIASRGESLNMVYLGSNQDAIFSGARIGIFEEDCLTYEDDDIDRVFECLGDKITKVRIGDATRVSFERKDTPITVKVTAEDFEEIEDDDDDCVFESLGRK